MSIFGHHSVVLADRRDIVRSCFIVGTARPRPFVEAALTAFIRNGTITEIRCHG